MNKEPIKEFTSDAQLTACVEYWVKALFLTDWIIHVRIVDELVDDEGEECMGHIDFQMVNKCADIQLRRKPEGDERDYAKKEYQELALVHELCHLKRGWLDAPDGHEGLYYNTLEHQAVEEMAKTLIMVKYELDFDWFKNPEYMKQAPTTAMTQATQAIAAQAADTADALSRQARTIKQALENALAASA